MNPFPHLFAPGRIGRRTLHNRVLMAPMEKNLAISSTSRPASTRARSGSSRAHAGGPPVFEIGDGVQPCTAFEAMQEGAALGHRL